MVIKNLDEEWVIAETKEEKRRIQQYEIIKQELRLLNRNIEKLFERFEQITDEEDYLIATRLIKWIWGNWTEENIAVGDITKKKVCSLFSEYYVLKYFEILEKQGYLERNYQPVRINNRLTHRSWKILKENTDGTYCPE